MKTLEAKIADLRADNKKEMDRKIKELELKEEFLKLTGLNFMVCVHSEKSVSVWIENNQWDSSKFNRADIKKYYDAICTKFKPENAVLTFAAKAPLQTFAPVTISFSNLTEEIVWDLQQTVSIEFTFKNGVHVSFKMLTSSKPFENIASISYSPNNRLKKAKYKDVYFLSGYGRIQYTGHNHVSYCRDEDERKDFMDVVFYGSEQE